MSTPFQNRLVGTIIVVAAAVIFLPHVLDGEKQTHNETFKNIPERPQFHTLELEPDFPQQKLEQHLPQQISQDDVVAVDATAPESSSSTNTVPEPEQAVETSNEAMEGPAYVIQLGSFQHKKNVDRLIKKLQKAGFTVFSQQITSRQRQMTKVFVGPDVSREKLEKALPEINRLTKLKGKITVFNVG